MNLNKGRLPPSPRSRHARKPVFSISQFQTNSLDRLKINKQNTNKQINTPITARSTKQKTYDGQIINNTQLTTDNIIKNNINKYNQKLICKNHKNRKSINQTKNKIPPQYYCFQCSLHEARKGIKLTSIITKQQHIKSTSQNNIRQYQLNNYLIHNQSLQNNIQSCMTSKLSFISKLQCQYKELIHQEKLGFQENMRKISQQYVKNLQFISTMKKQLISQIQNIMENLQYKLKIVVSSRKDIQSNYKDCLRQFNQLQFRAVMDKYWNQIRQSSNFLQQQQQANKTQQPLMKKLQRMPISQQQNSQNEKQFTFSKNMIYETPKSNTKFQKITIKSTSHQDQIFKRTHSFGFVKDCPTTTS